MGVIEVDRGYEIDDAIIVNGRAITFGDQAPWLHPVVGAPPGSIHFVENGDVYVKSGVTGNSLEVDWGEKLSNVEIDILGSGIDFCFRDTFNDIIELNLDGEIDFTFRDGTNDGIGVIV